MTFGIKNLAAVELWIRGEAYSRSGLSVNCTGTDLRIHDNTVARALSDGCTPPNRDRHSSHPSVVAWSMCGWDTNATKSVLHSAIRRNIQNHKNTPCVSVESSSDDMAMCVRLQMPIDIHARYHKTEVLPKGWRRPKVIACKDPEVVGERYDTPAVGISVCLRDTSNRYRVNMRPMVRKNGDVTEVYIPKPKEMTEHAGILISSVVGEVRTYGLSVHGLHRKIDMPGMVYAKLAVTIKLSPKSAHLVLRTDGLARGNGATHHGEHYGVSRKQLAEVEIERGKWHAITMDTFFKEGRLGCEFNEVGDTKHVAKYKRDMLRKRLIEMGARNS